MMDNLKYGVKVLWDMVREVATDAYCWFLDVDYKFTGGFVAANYM